MGEYIITGDTEQFKSCLVCLCGKSLDNAKQILNRMLNNPTSSDKRIMNGLTNFKIEKVDEKDCWWKDNCD